MRVLLDEEMGAFSLLVPSYFPLACLAPMSPVARGNGEVFTMINSGHYPMKL